MRSALLRFIRRLRHRGLDISPGEHLDALGAIQQVRWHDRLAFREALRATLVKRVEYNNVFEEEFAAFFAPPPVPRGKGKGEKPGGGSKHPEEERPGRSGQSPEPRGEGAGEQHRGLRQQGVGERSGKQPGSHMEPGNAQAEDGGGRRITFHGTRPPGIERSVQALRSSELKHLTEAEVHELRRHVRTMARRLASRLSRRRKPSQRGPVDLKRTVRRSLQFGGVPFRLAHRRRKRAKADIVVLCDVSGSVVRAADLMLEFLQALYQGTGRLRVFGFTNRVSELTSILADQPASLADLAARTGVDLHAFSDFGGACYDFLQRFRGVLTRHSTLLVMGDGRSNYSDPMPWAFEELARAARRVIWLVPEARGRWNTADSRLAAYAPYCDLLAECHTLDRLLRALQKI